MSLHLKQRQSGQAIGLAAVAMIAVVGVVAFVLDLGFFLEGRRELQNTADSAALAGVVFLPDCSVASASCPDATFSNAKAAADAYVAANGPILRQLCGHPTLSVGPTPAAAPDSGAAGNYTTSVTQPGSLFYTFTVSLSCNPGFSFGRILFGSLKEPIAASATAAVGSLAEVNCAVPLAADGYSWGTASNNYGFVPGLGNMVDGSGNLLPNETNYKGPPYTNVLVGPPSQLTPTGSPGFNLNGGAGGDVTLLCLTGCSGTSVRDEFSGSQCDSVSIGDTPASGNKIGPISQGLRDRGYGNGNSSQSAACPDNLSSVVNTTTWKVTAASICLVDIGILASGGGNVVAFATLFLESWDGHAGNDVFTGVIVQTVHSGKIVGYRDSGTHATRLIR